MGSVDCNNTKKKKNSCSNILYQFSKQSIFIQFYKNQKIDSTEIKGLNSIWNGDRSFYCPSK